MPGAVTEPLEGLIYLQVVCNWRRLAERQAHARPLHRLPNRRTRALSGGWGHRIKQARVSTRIHERSIQCGGGTSSRMHVTWTRTYRYAVLGNVSRVAPEHEQRTARQVAREHVATKCACIGRKSERASIGSVHACVRARVRVGGRRCGRRCVCCVGWAQESSPSPVVMKRVPRSMGSALSMLSVQMGRG